MLLMDSSEKTSTLQIMAAFMPETAANPLKHTLLRTASSSLFLAYPYKFSTREIFFFDANKSVIIVTTTIILIATNFLHSS